MCIQYLPLNMMAIKWFANDTYIKKNRRTNTALLPFILKYGFDLYVEPIRMEVAASYFFLLPLCNCTGVYVLFSTSQALANRHSS
jgi:hypothetical protein